MPSDFVNKPKEEARQMTHRKRHAECLHAVCLNVCLNKAEPCSSLAYLQLELMDSNQELFVLIFKVLLPIFYGDHSIVFSFQRLDIVHRRLQDRTLQYE